MDQRMRRIARNESLLREANERIERTTAALFVVSPVPFLCECPDVDCTGPGG